MNHDLKCQALRVLIVDDSAVYRKILTEVVSEISGTELVGTAANGRLALERILAVQPGVVLLDVEMPEMGGLETLEIIHRDYPDIGVVMVSGMGKRAADITVEALERGAVDFVTKPEGSSPEDNRKILQDRLSPILWTFNTKRTLEIVRRKHHGQEGAGDALQPSEKKIARSTVTIRDAESSAKEEHEVPKEPRAAVDVDLVAVGISTGGPNALGVLIPALPGDLGVPVLIVQHMPPVFTASLAKSLERKSKLPVYEAAEGQVIEANTVYIAPGGKHMVVRREKDGGRFVVGLNENPPENSCRPAVDVLFRSIATMYGNTVLAVIMTGMGQDGLNGVKTLKQRGAYCLTQDEATCTIYGMPMAVAKAGLSDESLALESLAPRIAQLCRQRKGGK